ncbi:MAG: poly(A) polymerase [Micavibrio sp.]|nr:MAG: poly(A) polymerase [Micavibrio sp.]
MESVQKIELQQWMKAPETVAVIDALGLGKALFVGGCVRNTLLMRDVEDIDIATILTPEEAAERLEAAGIKVVPTGVEHGTVTAVSGGKGFEITTLRKDVETDGRRAVVAFTEDWAEDAQRRDFTMNTLLADMEGNIFDPTGQGLADLKARKVVFVGESTERIAEDYLRILRLFRFHALYGEGEIDAGALAACKVAADKIATLSAERITQEFFKIIAVDKPEDILRIMFDNNVLNEFFYPEYDPKLLGHFCEFQKRYGLIALPSRLFVLAGMKLDNVNNMEKLLLFPKVFRKDIESLSKVLEMDDLGNEQSVKVAVYRHGRVATAQALTLEVVLDRVVNGFAPKALDIIQNWEVPNLPVSGDDLMKAGIPEGPALGQKLSAIEEWWIGEGFVADKEACLKTQIQ